MAFSRYQKAREEVEVNLIPVMNLFVTLIPFLLLGTAFFHVAVIPTSIPSQTDKKSTASTETEAVTVDLIIEPDKIELSASNSALDEETLDGLALTIEKGEEGYDLEMLSKALYAIKQRFQKSDTVIILPKDDIPYQDIVRILDASREYVVNRGQIGEKRIPMFPVVVLSRKV